MHVEEAHVKKATLVVMVAWTLLAWADGGLAQTPPAQAAAMPVPAKNDYGSDQNWLCRPGRHDACDIDNSATIVAASGTVANETWQADPGAPIDCFYVYPTVSSDTTVNSDMHPDAPELGVVREQFARLASKCRPYAPLYRQVTVAGLVRSMTGTGFSLDRGLAFDDVRDAWHYYLEHDNQGRGVVLVSHSQGSFILIELIRQEIDGKPIQSRIISAIMPGAPLAVPKGKDLGGTFKSMPLCHAANQVGCAIAFSTFRSTLPPPANTLFGRVPDPAQEAACVNPAALGGGSGALKAYLSASGAVIVGAAVPRQWTTGTAVDTPFVTVPGLLTAECASNENGHYLKITVNADPNDPRTDDIGGDLRLGPAVQANWGLHLIDVNLVMGNLLDIIGEQTKTYLRK
jgi:hypothetical protein